MSISRFYKEHAALMRPGSPADHTQRMSDAYESVRDKWIGERRYVELAKAILANWTSGNCVEYMTPLSQALVTEGYIDAHRHLWTRTIKRQCETFFRVYSSIQHVKPSYARLMTIETDGFVETDTASYCDPERAAGFLLQRLVKDLHTWRCELVSVGLPTDDPDQVERSLQELKTPRIKVNKLPPNYSSKPTPLRGAA